MTAGGQEGSVLIDLLVHNNETYNVGDFCYIKSLIPTEKPTIGCIYALWQHIEGSGKGVNVNWFFRPEHTVHKYGFKWMEKEVLKTSRFQVHTEQELAGKCLVLHVKDYIRGKDSPILGSAIGTSAEHVYVCENRYNEHAKQVTKIKNWQSCLPEQIRNDEVNLDLYDSPLNLVRTTLAGEEVPEASPFTSKRRRDDDDSENVPKRRVTSRPDYNYVV